MEMYMGLDVSAKGTSLSVRRGGKHICQGKRPPDPETIGRMVNTQVLSAGRTGFEASPLSVNVRRASGV